MANLNALVDYNLIAPGKYSPLALACGGSIKEIAENLLKANADVNPKEGIPPIHVAVCNKSVEILELLLKYGILRKILFFDILKEQMSIIKAYHSYLHCTWQQNWDTSITYLL